MTVTRSLTIDLPDFAALTDDEVQEHVLARQRDGRWSAQTRWLLSQFQTDKLELNGAWAEHWRDWTCPACGRHKIDIARLTDHNVLLCQLEWHHDHFADHAIKIIRSLDSPGLPEELPRSAARAISASRALIERFSETLLCNDCNAADAAMKAQLGSQVPSFFSFRPSEIGRFIKPSPNSSHALDVAAGEEIWSVVRDDVAQRLAFAEMLGTRIAARQHDREEISLSLRRSADDRTLFHRLGSEAATARNRIDGIAEALVARSRSTAGRWSATQKKPRRKSKAPERQAFEELNASRVESSRWWRESGADWRCLCCDRTKFEIMRTSKKGGWTAKIMVVEDFIAETDPASLTRRAVYHNGPVVLGMHRQTGLCQDCRQILSDALTIRPASGADCLSLSQLRALAGNPIPHSMHDVSADAIGATIDGNAAWIAGVADYRAHQRQAADIATEECRMRIRSGLSAADARDLVVVKLVAAGKLSAHNPSGWFDWWMDEHDRMCAGR